MATGYEVKAYNDLSTIAAEFVRIRKLLTVLVEHLVKKEEEEEGSGET